MKSYRVLIGLALLLVAVFGRGAVVAIWDDIHLLHPTPETESAFLKNYTPEQVMDRFECKLPFSYTRKSASSAGYKFVSHDGGFEWYFAMPSEKWMPLMEALRGDRSAQLLQNGAQILSSGGDERSGFHFDYKLGHSMGTVTILPLVITPPSQIHRGGPLPEGTVETTARIDIAEKWFPE